MILRPALYNVMLCEAWCATMTKASPCFAKHVRTSITGQVLVVLSVAQMTNVRICMLTMPLLVALQHRRKPEARGSSGRAARLTMNRNVRSLVLLGSRVPRILQYVSGDLQYDNIA